MRIGIGLPAAVPGADMTTLGQWAADSERAGFAAVGVIDRLVYANLDPLIALAVAAGRTERVDLATTILSVGLGGRVVAHDLRVAQQRRHVVKVIGGHLAEGESRGRWGREHTGEPSGTPATGVSGRRPLPASRRAAHTRPRPPTAGSSQPRYFTNRAQRPPDLL